MSLPLLVCAFGVPGQVKTHGNSGWTAAFVASDWPAAIFELEVFVVAALIAVVVWVIGSPVFAGAVLLAFGFAATLCCQKFVNEVLEKVTSPVTGDLKLAWETDHHDYVSEPAGVKNSHGDVSEPAGTEAGFDGVMLRQVDLSCSSCKGSSDFGPRPRHSPVGLGSFSVRAPPLFRVRGSCSSSRVVREVPCVPLSQCVFALELASLGNPGNWLNGFLRLYCVCWCPRRDPGTVLPVTTGPGEAEVHIQRSKGTLRSF